MLELPVIATDVVWPVCTGLMCIRAGIYLEGRERLIQLKTSVIPENKDASGEAREARLLLGFDTKATNTGLMGLWASMLVLGGIPAILNALAHPGAALVAVVYLLAVLPIYYDVVVHKETGLLHIKDNSGALVGQALLICVVYTVSAWVYSTYLRM
jgi:hypothetical protein